MCLSQSTCFHLKPIVLIPLSFSGENQKEFNLLDSNKLEAKNCLWSIKNRYDNIIVLKKCKNENTEEEGIKRKTRHQSGNSRVTQKEIMCSSFLSLFCKKYERKDHWNYWCNGFFVRKKHTTRVWINGIRRDLICIFWYFFGLIGILNFSGFAVGWFIEIVSGMIFEL